MASTPPDRGIALLRASLLTVLGGHVVANLIFDRDQYVGAASIVQQHLQDPILFQAAFVALAALALSIWGRRRRSRQELFSSLGRIRLIGVLLVFQTFVFIAMEGSERLAIDAIFDVLDPVAPFGEDFVAELLVALVSALVLGGLGLATARVIHLAGRRSGGVAQPDLSLPATVSVRHRSVTLPAGSVRGPPAA